VNAQIPASPGRRQVLQSVLSSAVVAAAAPATLELSAPQRLNAQSNLCPDAALQALLDGNQRFAANQLTSITHDLKILKEQTVEKQEPFAADLATGKVTLA